MSLPWPHCIGGCPPRPAPIPADPGGGHFSTALPSGRPRWEHSTTDLQPWGGRRPRSGGLVKVTTSCRCLMKVGWSRWLLVVAAGFKRWTKMLPCWGIVPYQHSHKGMKSPTIPYPTNPTMAITPEVTASLSAIIPQSNMANDSGFFLKCPSVGLSATEFSEAGAGVP